MIYILQESNHGGESMLYGKKVTLRILQEEDLQERVVMCNDKYIQRMMSGQVSNNEIDLDSMQKWYKARKKEDLKYLTLEVFPFNLRAIKAYRKLGFSFAGKLESTEIKMIVNL